MRKVKRWMAIGLSVVLVLLMTACNQGTDTTTVATTQTTVVTTTQATTTIDGETDTTIVDVPTTDGTTAVGDTTTKTEATKQNRPWENWTGTTTVLTRPQVSTSVTTTQATTAVTTVVTPVTTPSQDQTPSGPVESSMHDMLQTYILSNTGPSYHSERDFLCSVGYYPDGNFDSDPVDTMFDSFIFLASPVWHSMGAWEGFSALDKADLERYYDVQFTKMANMDALNSAVGKVKQALNRPNYKVTVFLSYFNAVPIIRSFGEVDGRDLDLSKEEDRLAAMKWQIDEQIRRFEEGGYEHIEIGGFFYITEGIVGNYEGGTIVIPMIQYTNEYVRSLGYEALWNPYNHINTGYYRWEQLGFTRCTQQINYFPPNDNGEYTQLNSKTKDEIQATAERTAEYKMGITMEWSSIDHLYEDESLKHLNYAGTKHFKEYMEGGILYDYMGRDFTNYQLDGGPASVRVAFDSKVPYVFSQYQEMYKYIKGTLTLEDINWYNPAAQAD